MKELLKRFHFHGNTTAGQDYNLELLDIQTKYIVPCKSTAGEVSFKWLHVHHRILSTGSQLRTTYKTNNTM